MQKTATQPASSPAKSSRRAARDDRKFVVAFACQPVGCEVEFGWTEVIPAAEAGEGIPYAEQVFCSGLERTGCPVRADGGEHHNWERCPRMQRLVARLRGAVSLTQAGPGAAAPVADSSAELPALSP